MANGSEEKDMSKKELVSRKVFMARLGINDSTLFRWKQKGRLVAGRHFLKVCGRDLYLWEKDLLLDLLL